MLQCRLSEWHTFMNIDALNDFFDKHDEIKDRVCTV